MMNDEVLAGPTNINRIRLLDDSAATEDAFGPHKRIAGAINHLIRTEDGGRAIALVGTWGSGKSTVVNLLRKDTINQTGIADTPAVFVFDAWAHEGDPLKRTFLEQLIKFLEDKKWISEKTGEQKLAKLSQHYKETTTTTTPLLTKQGIVWGITFFFVAIGLAMVSSGNTDWRWNLIGFGLTALPAVVLAYGWLKSRKQRGKSTQCGESTQSGESIFRCFLNREIESAKIGTLESPDPTSVEFQSWFCKLAEEALTGQRRLLLVIDNLDRVDSTNALRLWSTMRTFVEFSFSQKPSWLPKIWVLVTFDENGIRHLWENDNSEIATAFFDKTFQVRFRVPAPLVSDWRKYLMQLLAEAFPSEKENEHYHICRIFEILMNEDRPPTPRELKVFVNQISAAYRTAPEAMSLPDIALFALLIERNDWNPSKELEEQELIEKDVSLDWKQNMAALYYGMRRNEAAQVMMQGPVKQAISTGNRELLKEQSTKYGFDFVIERVVDNDISTWKANDAPMIGKAAFVLSAVKLADQADRIIYDRLISAFQNVPTWQRLDRTAGIGLAHLIKRAKYGEALKKFLSSLTGSSPVTDKSSPNEKDISNWLQGVEVIFDDIIKDSQTDIIKQNFRLAKTPEEYIIIMAGVEKHVNSQFWPYFIPGPDAQTVINLLNCVGVDALGPRHETAIRAMFGMDYKWPWESMIGLVEKLRTAQPVVSHWAYLIRILLILRNTSLAKNIKSEHTNGHIFPLLYYARVVQHNETMAAVVLLVLLIDQELNLVRQQQSVTQNGINFYRDYLASPTQTKPVLDEVIRLVTVNNCSQELVKIRKQDSLSKNLIDNILKQLAQSEDRCKHFPAEFIAAYYPTLKLALEHEVLEQLLSSSVKTDRLESALIKTVLSIPNCGLFLKVLQFRQSTLLRAYVAKSLKNLTSGDWSQALTSPTDLLALVSELVKLDVPVGVGHRLQDALLNVAEMSISGEISEHIKPKTCQDLVKILDDEQQAVFRRNLLYKLIHAKESIAQIVTLFPDEVADCSVLSEKADELVRIGFRNIVNRCNPTEYEWLLRILRNCPSVNKNCPKDTWNDFAARVEEEVDKTTISNECIGPLKQIQSHLSGQKRTNNTKKNDVIRVS